MLVQQLLGQTSRLDRVLWFYGRSKHTSYCYWRTVVCVYQRSNKRYQEARSRRADPPDASHAEHRSTPASYAIQL